MGFLCCFFFVVFFFYGRSGLLSIYGIYKCTQSWNVISSPSTNKLSACWQMVKKDQQNISVSLTAPHLDCSAQRSGKCPSRDFRRKRRVRSSTSPTRARPSCVLRTLRYLRRWLTSITCTACSSCAVSTYTETSLTPTVSACSGSLR